MGYLRLTGTLSVLCELDEWLQRRLRQLLWKRWKRGTARWQEVVSPGVPRNLAVLGATWLTSRRTLVLCGARKSGLSSGQRRESHLALDLGT